MITLIAGLLMEHKILVHSQHYVLLITVLQSLIDLLLPFQWPHTYIPTVPSNLLEFVDAPTPYIMGVHASQMQMIPSQLEDTILVDLDRNTVRTPIYFIPLPEDLNEWIGERLAATLLKFGVSQKSNDFREAEFEKIDLVFATRTAGYDGSSSDSEFTMELRVRFLSLYARLFGDYSKYVNKRVNASGMTIFDEPAFTAAKDVRHQEFLSECACRTLFELFLAAPEPKLFTLVSRLAMLHSESDVIAIVQRMQATEADWLQIDVAAPEPGTTICSYTHFPALDHSRYSAANVAAVDASMTNERLQSNISRKVRSLLSMESTREFVAIVEGIHLLLLGMFESDETDSIVSARVEGWFRGDRVNVNAEAFERRDRGDSGAGQSSSRLKKRMNRLTHKLRPISRSQPKPLARDSSGGDILVDTVGSLDHQGKNPDIWGGEIAAESTMDEPQRLSALSAMRTFLEVLRFYNDAGEVRLKRGPFKDLCRMLALVFDQCHVGLTLCEDLSKPSPEISDGLMESGGSVAVCWACSETNPANYRTCSACDEGPLGAGDLSDSQEEEEGETGGISSLPLSSHSSPPPLPSLPPPLPPKPTFRRVVVLYKPSTAEEEYFQVIKSALVVGSAASYSSSEGVALQYLFVEKTTWAILKRYEFWEWCIFSDYESKAQVQVKDPMQVPAYPDLFSIAAFYANCMASLHLTHSTAQQYLKQLPVKKEITETLAQLSFRMYELAESDSGPGVNANMTSVEHRKSSQGGVRVLAKQGSVRKNVAARISSAANKHQITVPENRPKPPGDCN